MNWSDAHVGSVPHSGAGLSPQSPPHRPPAHAIVSPRIAIPDDHCVTGMPSLPNFVQAPTHAEVKRAEGSPPSRNLASLRRNSGDQEAVRATAYRARAVRNNIPA